MGTISVSLPSDGTTGDVSDYNTPITTIVNEINGNIDNDNIKANAAIAGSKIADDGITANKIDWASTGANGGIWWEEIGRTTLGSAGDTITVSGLPARKYLRLQICVQSTGGTIRTSLNFNGDTGATYVGRQGSNGAADTTTLSASTIQLDSGAATGNWLIVADIVNIATAEKLVISWSSEGGTAGATNVPSRREAVYKWTNTTNAISSVTVTQNTGTGDFAIGSEVVVLGHN